MRTLKKLLNRFIDLFTISPSDTGKPIEPGRRLSAEKSVPQRIEESFLAVAFAEADDLKDMKLVLKAGKELAHQEECRYGDNDMCLNESYV